jgi:hypothetical protein
MTRSVANNAKTKNLHRLVAYVARLLCKAQQQRNAEAGEAAAAAAAATDGPARGVEDDPTTLLNGLYLVRVFVKHLIENTDARELLDHLQTDSESGMTSLAHVNRALVVLCSSLMSESALMSHRMHDASRDSHPAGACANGLLFTTTCQVLQRCHLHL